MMDLIVHIAKPRAPCGNLVKVNPQSEVNDDKSGLLVIIDTLPMMLHMLCCTVRALKLKDFTYANVISIFT